MSITLAGRNILITGASSGLGAHFAYITATAGANVALCARRKEKLNALCKDIEKLGVKACSIAMDVSDENSVVDGISKVVKQLGSVDSVIANAGINSEGMALSVDAQAFNKVLSVNLTGTFLTAREGAKHMINAGSREREHGRIVLISSITARKVSAGIAAYSASKAGVLQMGKVMAREWANKGISVNIVCPGYIETDLNRDWFETDGGKKQIQKFPRRRLLQQTDMDPTILLLCSDQAKGITGSVFTVDDGQSL